MKKRNGFVSNSSSSSFVISKRNLTPTQIEQICDHILWGERFGIECANSSNEWSIYESSNEWSIYEDGGDGGDGNTPTEEISGSTLMDNFDMQEFFQKIGVQSKFVRWGDGYSGRTYEREYKVETPSWVRNIEYECPNCNNTFWGKPLVTVKCCPYCEFTM